MTNEPFEYRFSDCVLNSATRELRVRDVVTPVAPRALDLLLVLIEQRARVVTKEELMTLLWKGAVLSDGVLAQAVRKARAAIGDVGSTMIKTVHRIGYRFVAEVRSRPLPSPTGAVVAGTQPRPLVWTMRWHEPGMPDARFESTARSHLDPQWLNGGPLPAVSLARLRARLAGGLTLFVLDDEVALWESALTATHGAERLTVLLPLAWHLRQRDSRRALSLADEAEALLGVLAGREAAAGLARMALVRGEAKWLAGHLDVAGDRAKQAITVAWGSVDEAIRCDAEMLLAMIATDQGRRAQATAHFDAALGAATAAADDERVAVVKLAMAFCAILFDPAEGTATWAAFVQERPADEPPGIVAWREKCEVAICAGLTGDSGKALKHCLAGIESARATGQRRELITQMTNAASRLCLLGDFEAAFEWLDQALQMARAAGWPLLVVMALQQGAHVLKVVGRDDEAEQFLDESLVLLEKFPRSRSVCTTLYYLAFLQFDRRQFGLALKTFEQLLEAATALESTHWIDEATMGRARSLAALGRVDEALPVGIAALAQASASGNGAQLPYILEGLAEMYGQPGAPPLPGIVEGSARLHFLLRAVEAHESLRKQPVRGMLWELLAEEYARLGNYERAYAMQRRAAESHAATLTTAATDRAVAMKVRYDTERVRAESEHHRALAAAQAERAAALARTNAVLDRLAFIGQQIARQRGMVAVFETLERHAHELLDTSTLAVFVLDEPGAWLELAFGLEGPQKLPPARIAVGHPHSNVARCWREQREILAEAGSDTPCPHEPGTLPTISALYAPLVVGSNQLGVLTIQSVRARAYGERERLVFRTLAAYGAIALDHATAYRRLESLLEAQALPPEAESSASR